MKIEEKIEILTALGLTLNQARVYLTLNQAGPITAKKLAEISKINRSDIYRVIPTLQEEGIIEELMTKPASFQAIPLAQVLSTRLTRETEKQKKLKKEIDDFLREAQNNHSSISQSIERKEFIVVPQKDAIIGRLKKALNATEASVCTVTSQKRFSSAIVEFEQGYKDALKRNVKIKVCTEKQIISKEATKIIQSLTANPNFEVRYFAGAPSAIVSLFDGKEASVMMTADAHLTGASAIWSSNPCFVALAQSYFENKYRESH